MVYSHIFMLLATAATFTHATNRKINYVDKFDKNPKLIALSEPLNDVRDTAGGALQYNAFGYDNLDVLGLGLTLRADTSPQAIGSGVTGTTLRGQRFWKPINDSILSYTENSIAYACIAFTAVGAGISVPITCTIQVAGKKRGTDNTVVQDLLYNPGVPIVGALGSKMATATFGKDFTDLTKTDVTLADFPVPISLIVIIFDTHNYTVTYKS